jgi:hypothetical protein
MLIYLVWPGHFCIPIEPCKYDKRWKVMGREFYIDTACAKRTAAPHGMPHDAEYWRLSNDEGLFHEMLQSWMANTLVLYRGFPGCHFCWPDLLSGVLESEGVLDRPEFTMSDSGKGSTCWLPTADQAMAEGVSIQCCDPFTAQLANRIPVPIGFTVRINCGSGSGVPVCWLNAGEIVVKGPLREPKWAMHSISWLYLGQIEFRPWPINMPDAYLPPQRPYQPKSLEAVHDWWDTCTMWMGNCQRGDIVLRQHIARIAQFAIARRLMERYSQEELAMMIAESRPTHEERRRVEAEVRNIVIRQSLENSGLV